MLKKKIGLITLISLILGCLFGYFFKEKSLAIEFIGTYYISTLKVMITPLLFTSISLTIYQTSKKKDHQIIKTIVLFIIMFIITFLITSLIVLIIKPGININLIDEEWTGQTNQISILSILKNLLPKNLNDIFINPKVFFIIFIVFVFGKISSYFKLDKLFNYIEIFKNFIYKVLEIIIYITPFATFSLMANTIYKYGSIFFGVGLGYILTAYLAAIISMFVVMILPLKIFCGIGILEFIKKVYKIWIMTISTCSSASTLPFTVKLCNEEFNIPSETTDVVVPLGCTIHMCGGAVSFALHGLFCMNIYGIQIDIGTYILMILAALFINMAAPGIPNGGVVIGATYLQLFGIPLSFIGFYSGIYKLLDMIYTTLNVTGDISANILINYSNEKKKKS